MYRYFSTEGVAGGLAARGHGGAPAAGGGYHDEPAGAGRHGVGPDGPRPSGRPPTP